MLFESVCTLVAGNYSFVVVQSFIHVLLFVTPCTAACQDSLSFTISWSLLKLMSIESMRISNHLILCHPLLLLPSIFPSIRVFSNESALHIRWPKYWSFSFSISSSSQYSELISFSIEWGLISLQSKDSQECFPAPQVKGISSSVLSLFYCPALTSIHDNHKSHSYDNADLCQ